MSNLQFLSSEDFSIQKGAKGDIMCHPIPGFSLILFYSPHCEHCQLLIPIFKTLPGTVMGCQFGVVNVSLHKEAVMMSQNTIDPIRFVPRIILYINGRPYMAYRGPHDGGEIRRFIKEITDNLQKKQQFSGGERVKDGTPIQQVNSPTTGVPVCDDKVCYLDFGKAYNPKR